MTKEIEAIYQKLLNEIITLRIVPGARLGEVRLSERFGVSRTPMRDVLKKLESDGLLDIHSQSGSYVSKIDLSGINDIMYLRSVAEYRVMLEAIDKMTSEDIVMLRLIIDKSGEILQGDGSEEKIASTFFEIDNDFHYAIFSKVGKGSVLTLLNSAFPSFQRYRFLTFYRDESDIFSLLRVHNEIVDCLEKKDKSSLENVINEHNYSGLHGIDKVISRHPDYFLNKGEKQ